MVSSPEHKMLMCKLDSAFPPDSNILLQRKGFLYKCIPKERGGRRVIGHKGPNLAWPESKEYYSQFYVLT